MSLLLFFIVYKNPGIVPGDGKNTVHCDFENYPGDKVCYVNPKEWSYCSSENHYSYHRSAPCIFLKLNKVSHKSGLKKIGNKAHIINIERGSQSSVMHLSIWIKIKEYIVLKM
jgi:hypothetical protein